MKKITLALSLGVISTILLSSHCFAQAQVNVDLPNYSGHEPIGEYTGTQVLPPKGQIGEVANSATTTVPKKHHRHSRKYQAERAEEKASAEGGFFSNLFKSKKSSLESDHPELMDQEVNTKQAVAVKAQKIDNESDGWLSNLFSSSNKVTGSSNLPMDNTINTTGKAVKAGRPEDIPVSN